MRWFVILVFLRPIIDNFYFLKEVSPFLSPLYIAGVLTPILIVYSTFNRKSPSPSGADKIIKVWSVIMCSGILLMGWRDFFSIDFFFTAFKISFILYLYFFLRYFIRSLKDVEGLLQTFLYSSFFIIIVFLYETFVNPIQVNYSRGMERIMGNYADIFNYAGYVILCTIISFYFYLKKDSSSSKAVRLINLIITLVLAISILFSISHTASYGVFLAIVIIYLIVAFKENAIIGLSFFAVICLFAYLFGEKTIEEKILPLIKTDLAVYEGDVETSYMFHGRMGRWESFLGVFNESNLLTQFFGLPMRDLEYLYVYLLIAPHNDYLRILLCTGYIGLFCYLAFLFFVLKKIIKYNSSVLFLGLASFASICLYSISTLPTLYSSFLYIVLSIFVFFLLPHNRNNKFPI